MLTFAQFERELTSERTKDKLLERARKGIWNGGRPPFGYERKNKKLIINKKEVEIVRMIFDTYLETGSIVELFNFLKDKNIKNRQGKDFSKPFLAHILRNITYAGKINYAGQIHQGIHQPIVSQELFDLAQKTHKRRIKKFRVYKHFLLGGLIRCKECGYKMSACFTNKHKKGKLKRYYYYRCVSVDKKGWQACSTKQVSAERIERYILENLERVSIDKSYIENLVFKLNHSLKGSSHSLKNSGSPVKDGHEPPETCSKFSSEAVGSLLQSFLSFLSQRRGVERNLLVKRFIKEIVYSKENIEINLFYRLNSVNSQVSEIKNRTALLSQGSLNFSDRNEASSFPPQQKQFATKNLGGRAWI